MKTLVGEAFSTRRRQALLTINLREGLFPALLNIVSTGQLSPLLNRGTEAGISLKLILSKIFREMKISHSVSAISRSRNLLVYYSSFLCVMNIKFLISRMVGFPE